MEPNTQDINEQNPGVANQSTPAQDVQPQTPTGMPLPQAAPTAQPTQPANPATAQQPLAFRKSMFDRVLESMAGGPTKVTNPQTGVTTELPMTKKSLTSHILAGAITGIISGAQASAGAPSGPAGTNTPANMAALSAGFNATGQKLQDIRNQPQTQLDQSMIRRAAAIKNTTDELRNQLMSDKLHEEDWSSKEDYYSKTRDTWQPVVDNIEQADKDRAPNTPSLFVARALSSDEAMAKVKGAVGQMSPVQDGWTTETHSDGRTYHLPTFALVSNGTVPVSKDTLLALSPFNKGVADAVNSKIGDTVELPATMLIGLEKQAGLAHGIYEFINQIQNGLDVPADQQLSQSAFNDQFRNNPALQRQAAQLGTTLSNLSTQSTAHALAQLQASGKAGEIFKLIGKSPDDMNKYIQDKKNEETEAAAHAAGASKETIAADKNTTSEDIAGKKITAAKEKAASANQSNFADFQTPDALGFQPTANKFADTEKEAVKQYNKFKTPFKKDADGLAKMEGTYQQFDAILRDIKAGKDLTGAQSVVALFNAIGISAEPLAGKGFRITGQTIEEHRDALSMPDNLVKKGVATFKNGEVVTPRQIQDYADIAMQTRQSKYVNLVNQVHNQGLNADFVLPTGNGEKIDPATAKIFLQLAGGNAAKARQAATAKGWNF